MKSLQLQELKERFEKVFNNLEPKFKEAIFDIVFFGSAVKGKTDTTDFDVCVVFRTKVEPSSVLKKFEASGVHLSSLFLEELFAAPLWLTLLLEGESLLQKKKIPAIFNFESKIIFIYNLRNLSSTEKTKFSHALYGRKKDGVLYDLNAEPLGKGSVLVPRDKSEEFRALLEQWGIDYSAKECLVFR